MYPHVSLCIPKKDVINCQLKRISWTSISFSGWNARILNETPSKKDLMDFNLILGLECNELHATCNARHSEKDLMDLNLFLGLNCNELHATCNARHSEKDLVDLNLFLGLDCNELHAACNERVPCPRGYIHVKVGDAQIGSTKFSFPTQLVASFFPCRSHDPKEFVSKEPRFEHVQLWSGV